MKSRRILKFSGISILVSLFLYAQLSSRKQSEHVWKHPTRIEEFEKFSNLREKLKDKFPKFANNTEDHPIILVYPWHRESYDHEWQVIGNHKLSPNFRLAKSYHNLESHEENGNTNFIYQVPESCGSCYITAESSFEKVAAAIIVENTVTGGLVKNESFTRWFL